MIETKDNTVFKQARDAAKKRLEEVEAEYRRLENERLSLQATVASLDELLNEGESIYGNALATALESMQASMNTANLAFADALDPLHGLTESCRQLLTASPSEGVQASEIVKMLDTGGFDISRYSSPVSAVQTVLTRLCRKGSASIVGRTPGGRPLYAATAGKTLQELMGRGQAGGGSQKLMQGTYKKVAEEEKKI